jgi:signal peptidase II
MKLSNTQSICCFFLLSAVLVIFDQLSKHYITANFTYGVPQQILSWLNFTWINNTGAAFSFLADMGGWQRWFLSGVSIIASIALGVWLVVTPSQQWLLRLTIALILGGAFGNLIDRVMLGFVVDFISVHYDKKYYFATFNIADSAISIGVVLLLIDMIRQAKQHHNS